MRPVRSFVLLATVAALSIACGAAAPGSASPSGGATLSPGVTPPGATASAAVTAAPIATPAVTPGATLPPAAGTAPPSSANTITYEITGEYDASGEAVFNEEASIYWEEGQYDSHEGWVGYFDAGEVSLRVSTRPDQEGIEFRDGEYVVVANSYPQSGNECTFTFTKNDPSGPVGTAVCERAVVHPNGSTYVNLSLEWNVNL